MRAKRQWIRWACLAGLLCAYLWIAWRVPYTHDDWDWGLPVGLERWLSGELNSRYSGTFFVLLMTRLPWVKTLVMGVCMFLIPQLTVCLAEVTPRRKLTIELLAHGLMFAVPIVTWRQTYGWVSSFANYVTAAVWMLCILLLLRRALTGQGKGWQAVLLFPLCLTGQLFVENLTVFLVVLTLAAAGYAWKTQQGCAAAGCALAGALAGLVLMFYNPLYSDLLQNGKAVEDFRQLVFPAGAGLGEMVSAVLAQGFHFVLPGLFDAHPVLWAVLLLVCLFRAGRRGRPWFLLVPAGVVSLVYLAFRWRYVFRQSRVLPVEPWSWPRTVGAVVLLVLLVLALWDDQKHRWPGLLLLASALLLVAPFALITEFGPRCCYPSLILLLLLTLRLVRGLPLARWHRTVIALACLGLLLFHLYAYWKIGQCEALRADLLQEAVAQHAQSVTLPTDSSTVIYMWNRNPSSDLRADYFRQFYGLPEDLQLIFLPRGSFDLWPDIPQEMLENASVFD